ncbi:MAG: DUF4160 domain-containing protein [Candidatus Electrothrix sp. YB6]
MPTISMFYGIIVRMFCAPSEHNPPHIHAYYQDDKAVVDIQKCKITEGQLPRKQKRLILAWVEIHQDELLANWSLASKGELPFKIDPLK